MLPRDARACVPTITRFAATRWGIVTSPTRVRDVFRTDLITVSPDDDVAHAVNLMVLHDVSGLPVVDSTGALVGILTERDCIRVALSAGYFDELGGLVSEYMSSPVETVEVTDNLADVAQRLCDSTFRRFPVLSQGKLVGIISRRDVLRSLQRGTWFKQPSSSASGSDVERKRGR